MDTIRIEGLSELGEALKRFPEAIGKKYLRRATLAAANVFKQDMIERAPFRTGALREHIATFRRTAPDASTAFYAVGVRKIRLSRKTKRVASALRKILGLTPGQHLSITGDVYYWRYLEFGTSKMKARPFIRPAFDTKAAAAGDAFREALSDGVDAALAEVGA